MTNGISSNSLYIVLNSVQEVVRIYFTNTCAEWSGEFVEEKTAAHLEYWTAQGTASTAHCLLP